ncbi:MAG: hypothetical protein A3A27_02030 [Candidatus Wildermuthbacteria bacterium RIFCSPLOWO2_01_FULL_47_18]|uniref:CARDB domain-containing protein n=1 Tax=Candidatus Wildermuthbacteria bacterium RIFCSPLOWO2_01_FULL_47_18 TaxID=1802460 RepID=A0A1G2RHU8_9BACT|nr:MAG: hypothetical protein A3A27_02030 [Candidatus Wildermuthbacteria bacterium RIFCSPLOWO2_01_FULL_47_18]
MLKLVLSCAILAAVVFSVLFFSSPDSVAKVIGNVKIPLWLPDYDIAVYTRGNYGDSLQEGILILTVGDTAQLFATTRNSGSTSSSRVSHTVVENGFDFFIPALGSGKDVTKQFSFTCEKQGMRVLSARADYYDSVRESDESNNEALISVSCVNFSPKA